MSDSQESSAYLSFPRRLSGAPSPEFGLPRECYCGRNALLLTSHTTANPRRYFTCRNREDGGQHIWKWLDEAMLEQFTIVHLRLKEADESYELVLRRLGCGESSIVDPSGRIFSEEIREVKESIEALEKDIAELNTVVRNISNGHMVDLKYVLFAGLTVLGLVAAKLFN